MFIFLTVSALLSFTLMDIIIIVSKTDFTENKKFKINDFLYKDFYCYEFPLFLFIFIILNSIYKSLELVVL